MLNYCVRYGNRWDHSAIVTGLLAETGNFLSSQGVSTQVLSTSECLTTVFGMGTGGTIQASSPDILLSLHISTFPQNYTEEKLVTNILYFMAASGQRLPINFALRAHFLGHLALHKRFARKQACGSLFIAYEAFTNQLHPPGSLLRCFSNKISPRHISTGPLHMLPRFYSQPICLVFFKVSY